MIDTNTIYRMSRPYSELKESIKGYKNYFFYTNTIGRNKALIEGGINPIGDNLPDGRIPAILININPLKSGSEDTPWMDIIDNDNGFIRYAGDNKPGSNNPDTVSNLKMINQYEFLKQKNGYKYDALFKFKMLQEISTFNNIKTKYLDKYGFPK